MGSKRRGSGNAEPSLLIGRFNPWRTWRPSRRTAFRKPPRNPGPCRRSGPCRHWPNPCRRSGPCRRCRPCTCPQRSPASTPSKPPRRPGTGSRRRRRAWRRTWNSTSWRSPRWLFEYRDVTLRASVDRSIKDPHNAGGRGGCQSDRGDFPQDVKSPWFYCSSRTSYGVSCDLVTEFQKKIFFFLTGHPVDV